MALRRHRHRHGELPLRPPRPLPASQTLPCLHTTMRPTPACFAPGFFKRSLDEFKRLSNYGELQATPAACMRRH